MRLLNTKTLEIEDDQDWLERPDYAILSHRWEPKEVTFTSLSQNPALLKSDPSSLAEGLRASARKIRGACAKARIENPTLDYLWTDTCCIDKTNSEELREALNSMFMWYHEASVCYTFLGDVTFSGQTGNDMFKCDAKLDGNKASEWFERGWTLQELLAPCRMVFYDRNWKPMGSRDGLAQVIGRIAGINHGYLKDSEVQRLRFRQASVATRMGWMAGWTTTRVEDIAYSLLGIFDVSITPRYGEGHKAFSRLQETLLGSSNSFDELLFAWKVPGGGQLKCFKTRTSIPVFSDTKWGLLAPSPDCFQRSGDIVIVHDKVKQRLQAGFQRTHQGIAITLPYPEVRSTMTGSYKWAISFPLNCWRIENGQRATIVLDLTRDSGGAYQRTECGRLKSNSGASVGGTSSKRTFGIDQGTMYMTPVTIAQPQWNK